jgi:hypothetical protein
MAQVTLDAPLTLDPKQATKLVLRHAVLEFGPDVVQIAFDLVDATGKVIDRRSITADGAAVATWVNNQEATICARLMAKLGVTGVVT